MCDTENEAGDEAILKKKNIRKIKIGILKIYTFYAIIFQSIYRAFEAGVLGLQ